MWPTRYAVVAEPTQREPPSLDARPISMGRQQLFLDALALHAAAGVFDSTAVTIDSASRLHIGGLAFDARVAGRDHGDAGDQLSCALRSWLPAMLCWSRASAEIATALRGTLRGYEYAESSATERVS